MIEHWAIGISVLLIVSALILVSKYFLLWLQALAAGAHVSFLSLFAMTLRKINPRDVVQCKVMSVQAGLPSISTNSIEAQYLAGGNSKQVTLALIAASRADIALDWDTAAAIDLAGRDIVEAVRVSVNPRVIDCPDPNAANANTLCAVAKDGIQLIVRVRVTVRTNLQQLIGGATESTIIARVGQATISAIGSSDSYLDAMGDPLVITRRVLEMDLDSDSAFSIVSIDIADIDVGENIGAKLQVDQAEADIRIARASAETRRANAVALQQQMMAKTAGNRSAFVLAESEIPLALASAFKAGNLNRNGYQKPSVKSENRHSSFLIQEREMWPKKPASK